MKIKDLSKEKFGMLKPIYVTKKENGNVIWLCKCDCGNLKEITRRDLQHKKNPTRSCGCFKAIQIKNRCWKGHGDIPLSIWQPIIHNAKVRNIVFDISIEQAWELFLKQNRRCALTNELLFFAPSGYKKVRNTGTASLDRIDNSKGYTINNIQWVDKRINIMKNKLSNNDFIEWCRKVVKNADR